MIAVLHAHPLMPFIVGTTAQEMVLPAAGCAGCRSIQYAGSTVITSACLSGASSDGSSRWEGGVDRLDENTGLQLISCLAKAGSDHIWLHSIPYFIDFSGFGDWVLDFPKASRLVHGGAPCFKVEPCFQHVFDYV